MKSRIAQRFVRSLLTKFALNRVLACAAAVAICGHALAQTPLEVYDSAITADSDNGLTPAATLTAAVVLTGTAGSAFDFGATSGDATMEFILQGNPAAGASSFLAVGTNNPKSRLTFEAWDNTGQLGFTQGGAADYLFTPGVASPTNDTHIAYVWDPASKVMKVYVNGTLAGSATDVSTNFAMPTGPGWLGAAGQSSDEAMAGTIYRVTVYDSILQESVIKRHASAYGAHVSKALAAYDAAVTADAGSGLTPTATLISTVVLNGKGAADFDFKANADDVTMEFILEGDPGANNTAFLAVGENDSSSLRYELWDNTGQLGFTQAGIADYPFTPGVNSPTLPTHVTYAWNAAGSTMKLYVNGVLAGTTVGVSASFAMPYGMGRLGNNAAGTEPMVGTFYRVSVYDSLLDDAAILRHAKAFADLLSPPTIVSFTVTPATVGPGEPATLNWEVKNTTKVLVNGIDRTGVSSLSVSSSLSATYTLTAQNALGSTSAKVRLQVSPDLGAYDAAITADAAGGLVPVTKLTNIVVATGSGVPFDFGITSGDATMEVILEGDPAAGSGTAIATDYDESGAWRHSLRYSQWDAAGQLGFTKRAAADYALTPPVPASSWPTHVAYVWDATALTVKVYVNGSLAGEKTEVDSGFALPTGQGTLGDGMVGAILRITVYSGKVPEAKILSHGKAFLGAAEPALNAYDNTIEASTVGGLLPAARLFAPVTLTGANGVTFSFGTTTDDVTMEFILEGDPGANNTAFLAVGENGDSSLRYEVWNDTGELGFAQAGVADYQFTPGVASPSLLTHVTYAWNAASSTMKLYVNGALSGTTTGVSSSFAMPYGLGRLGNNLLGTEPMVGTFHRVTVYDNLLQESVILSHANVIGELGQKPVLALNTTGGVATVLLSQGVAGAHYLVEYRDSLSATDGWVLLQDIPALAGTTASVPDPTPIANRLQRYYRAVLVH